MGQQKHMRHVQEIIFLIDKDVQEREEKLQAKHEMEWNYLDQKIEDLKAALPPPPQFGASPGEPLRETAYAPHTIRKRQKERELAVEQKYEQANMMRQQIELDECDAYDELIAKHAAKVEHISDDLAQRQVGEMQRFIESTRRVDDMAPRIVRMCDVSAREEVYNDRHGPTLTNDERETLLELASDPLRMVEEPARMQKLRDVALARPGSPLRMKDSKAPMRHDSPSRTRNKPVRRRPDRSNSGANRKFLNSKYAPQYKTVRTLSPGRPGRGEPGGVQMEEMIRSLMDPIFRQVPTG